MIIFLEIHFFSLKCVFHLVSIDVIFLYLCISDMCLIIRGLFVHKFEELVGLT